MIVCYCEEEFLRLENNDSKTHHDMTSSTEARIPTLQVCGSANRLQSAPAKSYYNVCGSVVRQHAAAWMTVRGLTP